MSYQVLARKWRPKSFEELVGQKQTAKALMNALESKRLHHAYLFTGTRGVGKTTIARILSKSLNCEKGITSQPCGVCSSCTEIDQGNFVDLMEIDAASKTKVEDTRELLDNVQYRPTRGRYKVYLIDEVHMLSGHSFNALLKTLEEPPPHVIFLLATTDPQKLPVTVLSRCLQFHLKRMEQDDIVTHLSMILNAENITFEPAALTPIAKGADGSMRDALSLLDQAIAFSGEHLKASSVLEMLGSIDQSYCFSLLDAVQKNDASALMSVIHEMSQYSPDYFEVMTDWLSLLHNIAVAQAIGHSDDDKITELTQSISAADLQLYYQLSLQAKKDLPYAPHPKQGFEMALLRVLAFKPVTSPHSGSTQTPLDGNFSADVKKKQIDSELIQPKPANNQQNSLKAPQTLENLQHFTQEQTLQHEQIQEPQAISFNGQAAVQKIKNELGQPTNNIQLEPAQQQGKPQALKTTSVEANLRLVSNNSELIQAESDDVEKITKESEDKAEKKIHLENDNVNSEAKFSSGPDSDSDLSSDSIKLYPDVEKISLSAISFDNWHFVVDQMPIAANGIQVLLNSMAVFADDTLTINNLEKVGHFLTDNLKDSLLSAIKKHFSGGVPFNIEFKPVKELPETPKEKQIKLHEEALENAYQQLINDPCVSKLQHALGAKLDKETINLKTLEE